MGNQLCTPTPKRRKAAYKYSHDIEPTTLPTPRWFDSTYKLDFVSRVGVGDVWEKYVYTGQEVGSGMSGSVWLCKQRKTGKECVIKELPFSKEDFDQMQNEVNLYMKLDHPNISRLLEVIVTGDSVCLVMEYCSGGELFDRLCEAKSYCEAVCKKIVKQMLNAVHYLHTHGVVHRDLKLENWLFATKDKDAPLRLIDFGLSKNWSAATDNKMDIACGTIYYISPEALTGTYTNACDLWALGCIVYMMMVGYPPFYDADRDTLKEKIIEGRIDFSGKSWSKISETGKQFVKALLNVDVNKRLTAREALQHPWLSEVDTKIPQEIDKSVVSSMRKFARSSAIRRAALTVIAHSLTTKEIKHLSDLFLALDRSHEGTIRPRELREILREGRITDEDEIQQIFDSMDTNHDGEITFNDFVTAMLTAKLTFNEAMVKAAFEKFDLDKSGYITVANLWAIFEERMGYEEVIELMRQHDRDQDDLIDYNEFKAIVKKSSSVYIKAK